MGRRLLILFTKLAINALALLVADAMFSRIWFETTQATIAAAVVLALVNTYLRPLVILLTLPINILTLGLFTLVINAGLLWLVGQLLQPRFRVDDFGSAFWGALVISVISVLLNLFLKPDAVQVRVYRG